MLKEVYDIQTDVELGNYERIEKLKISEVEPLNLDSKDWDDIKVLSAFLKTQNIDVSLLKGQQWQKTLKLIENAPSVKLQIASLCEKESLKEKIVKALPAVTKITKAREEKGERSRFEGCLYLNSEVEKNIGWALQYTILETLVEPSLCEELCSAVVECMNLQSISFIEKYRSTYLKTLAFCKANKITFSYLCDRIMGVYTPWTSFIDDEIVVLPGTSKGILVVYFVNKNMNGKHVYMGVDSFKFMYDNKLFSEVMFKREKDVEVEIPYFKQCAIYEEEVPMKKVLHGGDYKSNPLDMTRD